MDFKSLLSQLDQLNEAKAKTKGKEEDITTDEEDVTESIMDEPETTDTPTGRIHKAKAGGYGRKDDEDDEGKKVKAAPVARGRGRPKKGADDSGEVKKYDWSQFGGPGPDKKKDIKLPKWDKSKTTKHSLKDWVERIEDSYLAEAEQIQIKPASQMPKLPGTVGALPQKQTVAGQPQKQTQVIAQGNKTLGTVDNPQLAQQIKQSIGKGEMTLMPEAGYSAKAARAGKDIGKPGKNFGKIAASAGEKYGSKAAGERVAGAVLAKLRGKTNESEQVNEISRKTVGAYKKAATADLNKVQARHDKNSEEDGWRYQDSQDEHDAWEHMNKRKQGLKRANGEKVKEGAHSQGYNELNPTKKPGIGSKIASAAKKVVGALTGPDDEGQIKDLQKKMGVAQTGRKPVKEADIPSDQMDMGAGLGAGRSATTLEGKKPDFLDLDKDGNKKESMKKAAQDKKKVAEGKVKELDMDLKELTDAEFKKKYGKTKAEMRQSLKTPVKEGAEHRLRAAHHAGKSHALSKQGYNCPFEDMEESRMYHDGFKEGLDECYGQMGMMDEDSTVDDMASFGAHTPTLADEGNAFTAGLAKTQAGHSFNLGGRNITDTSGYDSNLDEFAQFENWDNQLNALIEGKQVSEGMTVSISKGQQGTPDSVSVTAQDNEADQLLAIIKQAGLGLFGGDEQVASHDSSPMSAQADGEPAEIGSSGTEIDVVDDHDGMLALMKKMTGQGGDEGHADDTCESCGSAECQCDSGEEEVVDEVESYDQEEEVAAEAADSGAEETTSDENAEAAEDQALATADAGQDAEEGEEDAAEADEEQVTEWANDAGEDAKDFNDEGFQTDMDFMTKVISGGLNKPKSTGQTTIPVVAGQGLRTGANESISDWKKLAGI